jgi:hypothetical protein
MLTVPVAERTLNQSENKDRGDDNGYEYEPYLLRLRQRLEPKRHTSQHSEGVFPFRQRPLLNAMRRGWSHAALVKPRVNMAGGYWLAASGAILSLIRHLRAAGWAGN